MHAGVTLIVEVGLIDPPLGSSIRAAIGLLLQRVGVRLAGLEDVDAWNRIGLVPIEMVSSPASILREGSGEGRRMTTGSNGGGVGEGVV